MQFSLNLGLLALVALSIPGAASTVSASLRHENRGFSTHRGTPASPVVFDHNDDLTKKPLPPIQGFCDRTDKAPACTKAPCCCWSTYAGPKHPAFPNVEETIEGRRCMNEPPNFIYVRQPGFTHDDGHLASLSHAGATVYPGRDLCCLVSLDDPQVYSMRPPYHGAEGYRQEIPLPGALSAAPGPAVAESHPGFRKKIRWPPSSAGGASIAADPGAAPAPAGGLTTVSSPATAGVEQEGPSVDSERADQSEKVGPVTEAASAPSSATTVAPTTTTDMLAGQDYETLQLEGAARAHRAAANDLSEAAGALGSAVGSLTEVRNKLETDPELIRRKQHVARMRAAIHNWAEKRFHNIEGLAHGDATHMVH